MNDLLKKHNITRVDVSICDCSFGPHIEVESASDGDYVRWEDVEQLLKKFDFTVKHYRNKTAKLEKEYSSLREETRKVLKAYDGINAVDLWDDSDIYKYPPSKNWVNLKDTLLSKVDKQFGKWFRRYLFSPKNKK